jgi:hypothetical protein
MSGARMIPSVCAANAPPGEKSVFARFASEAGCRGWTVLHSLDIARHNKQASGEADFVVIVPRRGIVALEIKSHDFIKYDEMGWWLGKSAEPEARGPFKQAAHAMHSIRSYLQERMPEVVQQTPFVSGVVFSEFHFNQKSPEWHAWQFIDKQALAGNTLASRIEAMLHHACQHYRLHGLRWIDPEALTAEHATSVAAVLRPKFEFLIKPADRIRKLKASVLTCTEQQLRLLDMFGDNERLVVQGPAGTGKTSFAIEALRREKLRSPDSTAALFCFNKLLGKQLEEACVSLGSSGKAGHLHGWLHKLAGAEFKQYPESYWSRDLPQAAVDLLLRSGPVVDYLIVDEAQDLLVDPYLDVFDLLLKGGLAKGRYFFLGDFERQRIFGRDNDPLARLADRSTRGLTKFKLDVNCRNTAEISGFIETLGQLRPGYSATLRGDTRVDPTLEFYGTTQAAVALLDRTLRGLMNEGYGAEDIVVLSTMAANSSAERLALDAKWRGLIEPFNFGGKKVRWSTVQGFKGLEAGAVVLTDINDVESNLAGDLFYVGMSRALHRLAIHAHDGTRNSIRAIIEQKP